MRQLKYLLIVCFTILLQLLNQNINAQCVPTVTGPQPGDSIGILKVELFDFAGGLLFSNQSDAEEGYVDRTALPAPLLLAGDNYILHVTTNNSNNDSLYMMAKMDFDNDSVLFGLASERIARWDKFPGNNALLIDTFNVPTGFSCDTINIRFRIAVSTDNLLDFKAFLCALSQLDGDIEDYTVRTIDSCFYCTPIASNNVSGDSIGILNLTLNTINNTTLPDQGYEDFTNIITTLGKGMTYNMIMTGGFTNQNLAAWIDYDQNKDYDVIGEAITPLTFFPTIPRLTPSINTFKVPLNVPSDTTRLRVVSNNVPISAFVFFGANCTDMLKGDIEEYSINIVDTIGFYTSQINRGCIYANSVDKIIMRIEVVNSYPNNIRTLTQFDFNTNGSTTPNVDITNAKLWYSGAVQGNLCNSSTLLATILNPNGNFSFTTSQPLSYDKNYFWLTYDISSTASINNKLDASFIQAIVDGNNYFPDSISPAKNYTICTKTDYRRKEANIWYLSRSFFYGSIGIDFNCSPPKLLGDANKAFSNIGGAGTISDKNGDLLFYTDGSEIYNRCHLPMLNGTGVVLGGGSKTFAIPFQNPGNPQQYYIISTYNASPPINRKALYYTLVDMSLDGGLGGVVPGKGNILLMDSIYGNDVVAVTSHCNNRDIWVLSGQTHTNIYKAFLFDSNGIAPPVISNAGLSYKYPRSVGTIKFSPNGKKMIVNLLQLQPDSSLPVPPQLFDFDNTTGIVSNPIPLNIRDGIGATFSPDNSKLYLSRDSTGEIYQYDLCNGNNRTFIGTDLGGGAGAIVGSAYFLQNAPDGKIYISSAAQPYSFVPTAAISVIANPNSPTPSFLPNGFPLDGKFLSPASFISGFNEAIFNQSVYSDSIYAGFDYVITCGDSIAFIDTTPDLPGCVVYPKTWFWDFGDPVSGIANTSTLQNPKHLFSNTGTYRVMMAIEEQCQRDTAYLDVTIISDTSYSLPSDTLCIGDFVQIGISSYNDSNIIYTWNPISNLINPDSATTLANPSITTTYTLTVSYGICADTITETVFVDTISINVSNDTVLCINDSIQLSATSNTGNNFLWTPNQFITNVTLSNPVVFPPVFTQYHVTTTNLSTGCSKSDSINIGIINAITSPLFDSVICSNLLLDASNINASGYLWSTGETTPKITITEPDTIWVQVFESSCIGLDTGIYEPCPSLFIPNSFSPNGDGDNDFLGIRSLGVKSLHWSIYDRWGNKVFRANGTTDQWNGKYLDKPVATGVYVYHIKGEFIDDKKIELKGNITLIR